MVVSVQKGSDAHEFCAMKRETKEYLQLLLAFAVVVIAAAIVMFVFVQCLGIATK